MKDIIFIAPPAAGKGTISKILVDKYQYIHISTGDLLRDAQKENTELGKQVAALIDAGKFAPDDIVLELLKNKLNSLTNAAFILDGCPRNITQVEPVLALFKAKNIQDYIVIYLDINYDIALKRILGRLVCPKCGKGYNLDNAKLKPKVNGICDNCQTKLIRRNDDNAETFKTRYDTYLKVTSPLIDYFKKINKLYVIDANDSAENIVKQIERIIK